MYDLYCRHSRNNTFCLDWDCSAFFGILQINEIPFEVIQRQNFEISNFAYRVKKRFLSLDDLDIVIPHQDCVVSNIIKGC